MANMRLDNARDPEQRRRMEEVGKKGKCYFCEVLKEQLSEIPSGRNWFVKKNDFPYQGSVHHYLIVSQEHITKLSDINASAQQELFVVIAHLEAVLGTTGVSVFVRSGDMAYTGATLDHLHFHFLVGERKSEDTEWLMITLGYKKK